MNDITVFTEKPCQDALDWLETQPNLASAWDNCERGDWLWWALRHLPEKMPTKAQSVQFARWCAERARDTAAVAADYAADDAAAAASAASYWADVADDAAAAYSAAAAAAAAAAEAADYAAAAYSAAAYWADPPDDDDDDYADYADYAAAFAADAAAADYDAEKQAQAEWIKENISNPFEGE